MKKLDDTNTVDTTTNYDEDTSVQSPLWHAKDNTTQNTTEAPIKEIVALTEKFIEIPSVTGDIEKSVQILQVVKEQLIDYKFTPYVANSFPSLLYSNQNTDKFKIILNAHLDVVPGEASQYVPRVRDGKLYGRGAYDMKGATAVMITLFNEIADQLDYPLGLQLVTDEELAGGSCTLSQLEHGVRTELAIIGECGSNLDIIHETKGLVHANLIATGSSAHGAYLWRGQNAILKMYEAINTLQQHFPTPTGETSETTINVSKIATANETWNRVPDDCIATLDIRFNKKDSETIIEKVKSLLPEGITLEIEQTRNAHFTDPNKEHLQTLRAVGKDFIGKEFNIRNTYGGSDTTFFSNFGCDAVEFGPVGHGQHDAEEWVSVQGLANYYQILKKFLLSVK
jgi:succinyl-diaminopimelate desuccinylase